MRVAQFFLLYGILVGVVMGGLFCFEEGFYFKDRQLLQPPLPTSSRLEIRQDRLGKGHFGAPRSGKRRHLGIDLLASSGEPVVAAKSGVAEVQYQPGMGTFVKIRHPDGLQTIYGHLSEVYLPARVRVRQGQVIGAVGKSGNASQEAILPHLHFEIRDGRKALDPTPLLKEALTES